MRFLELLAVVGLVGCVAANDRSPMAVTPPGLTPRREQPNTPWSESRSVVVTASPVGERVRHIAVELQLDGPPSELTVFSLDTGLRTEAPQNVTARDGVGTVRCDPKPSSDVWTLECGELRTPPLRLRYEVSRGTASWPGYGEDGTEVFVRGESTYLLPNAWDAESVRATWRLGSLTSTPMGAATSFALGTDQDADVLGAELRHSDILAAASLSWARLHDGNLALDRGAALGEPAFDPRWVIAELAGVRTGVDTYFGGKNDATFTYLIGTRFHREYEDPFTMDLRARSLWIDGHMMAPWSALARIRAAELLVGRWVGGRIRLIDEGEPAAWFASGFARHVARQLLLTVGLIDRFEFADDVNALESILATRPTPDDQKSEPGTLAARRDALVRGSRYAAHLEATLRRRSGHGFGLRELLRDVVIQSAQQGQRDIPVEKWRNVVRRAVGEADAKLLEAVLADPRSTRPPRDLYGPCVKPRAKLHRELEFGLGRPRHGEPVASVVSPALEAGIRPGDQIVDVTTETGNGSPRVRVSFMRDGTKQAVTYDAQTLEGRGWEWIQVESVPNIDCA